MPATAISTKFATPDCVTTGSVAPCVIDGPIDRATFLAWLKQFLIQTMRLGHIVVLHNVSRHKGAAIGRAVSRAGAHLLFLPQYSPDLNAIEQVFAKLKTLLRKANARSIAAGWHRIGELRQCFTPAECSNYLRHAGYASP